MPEPVNLPRLPAWLDRVARIDNEALDRSRFLRCDKNENLLPLPPRALARIRRAMTGDFLGCYPQPHLLLPPLARSLGLTPDQVYLTAGSDAGIKAVFEVLVRPGAQIVLPTPSYAMYGVYAQLFRARVTAIACDAHLQLPLAEVRRAITRRTALVIIANPNSPTGTAVERHELLRLVRYAGRLGVPVLVDEAYYPFHPETMVPHLRACPNLLVTRTFSKAYGLAAARLGCVAASPRFIAALKKWRPMYEVNGLAVIAGLALLAERRAVARMVRETVATREWLCRQLEQAGLPVLPSAANFLNVRVGRERVPAVLQRLRRHGVLAKTFSGHPLLAECVRISLGPRRDMARVARLLAAGGK